MACTPHHIAIMAECLQGTPEQIDAACELTTH
jgi:hypothetical protein